MTQNDKAKNVGRYFIRRATVRTHFTDKHFEQFVRILSQLGAPPKTLNKFDVLYTCENEFRLLARDSKNDDAIVGTAYIAILNPSLGKKGFIEDVVVDQNHQELGLGKQLVFALLTIARDQNCIYVDLTSGQSEKRQKANALYTAMGFKKRETNNYRLMLN